MKNLLFLLIPLFVACSTTNKTELVGRPMTQSETTSCQLIEKEFVNKGGKVTEYKELYLRCSIQDYFIKLCESDVTLKDLEPYIGSGISVKMEIKEGMWDYCDPNPAYAQSRTGTYVIIKSIEK